MTRVDALAVPVLLSAPTMEEDTFFNSEVTKDLDSFKKRCDVIIANRYSYELADVKDKLYTRDLFARD